jgi:hypothetical protein
MRTGNNDHTICRPVKRSTTLEKLTCRDRCQNLRPGELDPPPTAPQFWSLAQQETLSHPDRQQQTCSRVRSGSRPSLPWEGRLMRSARAPTHCPAVSSARPGPLQPLHGRGSARLRCSPPAVTATVQTMPILLGPPGARSRRQRPGQTSRAPALPPARSASRSTGRQGSSLGELVHPQGMACSACEAADAHFTATHPPAGRARMW